MPDDDRRKLHPLGLVGLLAFALCALAAVWLFDWRWLVTGVVALFALGAIGAMSDARRKL